jgi:fucokinase
VEPIRHNWDYLILTASNDRQAAAYEEQVRLRQRLGFLAGVRETLTVAGPGGRRIGSGGSNISCLMHILTRKLAARRANPRAPAPGASS